jgi:hypothetical protein
VTGIEQLVERKLVGDPEVLGENLQHVSNFLSLYVSARPEESE